MKPEKKYFPLMDITQDPRLQPRAALDMDTVEEYATRYAEGMDMVEITLFFDGEYYWLGDGFHRVAGAEKAGLDTIPADVREGTFRDALLFAAGANAAHGLRRTNADKRRAVEMLIGDAECAGWSDREIARHCQVGHPLVAEIRAESSGISSRCDGAEASGSSSRCETEYEDQFEYYDDGSLTRNIVHVPKKASATRTVTRNGITYQMNVGRIGKRSASVGAAPKPKLLPGVDGLLPCPYCGSADVYLSLGPAGNMGVCRNPDCIFFSSKTTDEEGARQKWNRRA